ncbi:MAG: hypothetical protein EPO07_08555 [Verrucomicrobia bacterium]|nr:MAG: hypothetical protein EPO07_08555 [Verrucomicrobiota bacterium]
MIAGNENPSPGLPATLSPSDGERAGVRGFRKFQRFFTKHHTTMFSSVSKKLSSKLAFILSLALLGGMNRATAAIPAAEQILPDDTLLLVSVPDCTKLGESFKKSPQAQLWNDPAMKPFKDKFISKWKEEFVAPLERDLGVKFDDYGKLAQGQFTFAVTLDGWDGKNDTSPAMVILLDAKTKSSQLKTNLSDLRKKWVDAGKTLRTEKIRDVEFSVVTLSSNDMPKTLQKFLPSKQDVQELGKEDEKKREPKSELVIGQFDSLLVISSSLRAAEKITARLGGSSTPALADQAQFDSARLAVFRDAPFFAWFNAKKLFGILGSLPPSTPNPEAPNPLPPFEPAKIVGALGLSGLNSAAFAYHDSNEGGSYEIYLAAPEATRAGLFKLLAPDAKDSNPSAFVPADALKFLRWRKDLQKAIATTEKMLGDISPQALNFWNYMLSNANEAARQQKPEFDIRKDLFAYFGDDLIVWEKSPRGTSLPELNDKPTLYLLGSPAPEKFVAALPSLLILLSPQAAAPKEREFLGRKIYSIDLVTPRLPSASGPVTQNKFNYAAGSGYVAMSTDATLLEEYLRSSDSQTKSLRETPGLNDAAQKIGGQSTGYFGYENQSETMRIAFDMLRKVAALQTNRPPETSVVENSLPFAHPQNSLKEWADFSLLPDYAKVSKYFGFSVFSGSANVDGLSLKIFTPSPSPVRPAAAATEKK